jgi:hypothetical protein
MEMINIINQNKARKQETLRKENIKELKKQERMDYIFTMLEYIVGTYIIVQIITMLVK